MRTLLVSTLAGALLLVAPRAHAEPASWFSLGLGWTGKHDVLTPSTDTALSLGAQIGIGSSLDYPFVVGAVAGMRENLSMGFDATLAARIATQGFMLGQWGVGVDLGVAAYASHLQAYGHFPFEPAILLGLPAGPVLEVGMDLGDVSGQKPSTEAVFVMLSIDIVRVVAARAHGTASFFPDPPPPSERTIERVQ